MADHNGTSNGNGGSLTYRWFVPLCLGAAAWLLVTNYNRVQRDIESLQTERQRLWEETRRLDQRMDQHGERLATVEERTK